MEEARNSTYSRHRKDTREHKRHLETDQRYLILDNHPLKPSTASKRRRIEAEEQHFFNQQNHTKDTAHQEQQFQTTTYEETHHTRDAPYLYRKKYIHQSTKTHEREQSDDNTPTTSNRRCKEQLEDVSSWKQNPIRNLTRGDSKTSKKSNTSIGYAPKVINRSPPRTEYHHHSPRHWMVRREGNEPENKSSYRNREHQHRHAPYGYQRAAGNSSRNIYYIHPNTTSQPPENPKPYDKRDRDPPTKQSTLGHRTRSMSTSRNSKGGTNRSHSAEEQTQRRVENPPVQQHRTDYSTSENITQRNRYRKEHQAHTTTTPTKRVYSVSTTKEELVKINPTRVETLPNNLNATARTLSKLIRARHHLEAISYYLSGSNLPPGYINKARTLTATYIPSGALDTTLEELSSASTLWIEQSHEILQRHYREEEEKMYASL